MSDPVPTDPLARLTQVEQQLEDAIDYRNAVAQDHLEEKARAEAAETALREAEEWIQEVDHVEDCAAFDRLSSRECDCGRTAILKRARTTTTEGERDA
jgi:Tfp pilus assembly protein PilX